MRVIDFGRHVIGGKEVLQLLHILGEVRGRRQLSFVGDGGIHADDTAAIVQQRPAAVAVPEICRVRDDLYRMRSRAFVMTKPTSRTFSGAAERSPWSRRW